MRLMALCREKDLFYKQRPVARGKKWVVGHWLVKIEDVRVAGTPSAQSVVVKQGPLDVAVGTQIGPVIFLTPAAFNDVAFSVEWVPRGK